MITLGIINGGLGLYLAGAAQSLKIAYGVIAGIVWLVWMLLAVFGEIRRGGSTRSSRGGSPRRKLSDGAS